MVPDPPPSCIRFECFPRAFCAGREFVEAWARHAGLEDREVGMVVLGCDEVFSNLSRHAYAARGGPHPVSCHAGIAGGRLSFRIVHSGAGLTNEDYLRLRRPPSCGERIGGLGLHVISEVFDKVDHRREGDEFVIELSRPVVDPSRRRL
jgi:anti-sigma regulatory factor (Ser/Thr protein kinase)